MNSKIRFLYLMALVMAQLSSMVACYPTEADRANKPKAELWTPLRDLDISGTWFVEDENASLPGEPNTLTFKMWGKHFPKVNYEIKTFQADGQCLHYKGQFSVDSDSLKIVDLPQADVDDDEFYNTLFLDNLQPEPCLDSQTWGNNLGTVTNILDDFANRSRGELCYRAMKAKRGTDFVATRENLEYLMQARFLVPTSNSADQRADRWSLAPVIEVATARLKGLVIPVGFFGFIDLNVVYEWRQKRVQYKSFSLKSKIEERHRLEVLCWNLIRENPRVL